MFDFFEQNICLKYLEMKLFVFFLFFILIITKNWVIIFVFFRFKSDERWIWKSIKRLLNIFRKKKNSFELFLLKKNINILLLTIISCLYRLNLIQKNTQTHIANKKKSKVQKKFFFFVNETKKMTIYYENWCVHIICAPFHRVCHESLNF